MNQGELELGAPKVKAWQLLEDPSKWCQNAGAVDADGNEVDYNSHFAVKWCALGAIDLCYEDGLACWQKILSEIGHAGQSLPEWISEWNDEPGRTHAEVLEVLTRLDI